MKKAKELAATLRAAVEKYKDYRVAIADGYRPFLPNARMPMYHFTNYWHGSSRPSLLILHVPLPCFTIRPRTAMS